MNTIVPLLVLASLAGACAEQVDNAGDSGDASTCEGKCDNPTMTSIPACVDLAPARGEYKLANPPAAVTQALRAWVQYASPRDSEVSDVTSSGYRFDIEKVIEQAGSRVVFQATMADYSDDAAYRGDPTLRSFVVFVDGTTIRWHHGRYEFGVGRSHFVNYTASGAYPGGYNVSLNGAKWLLISEQGNQLASIVTTGNPQFARLADDMVLWTNLPSNGLTPPLVIRQDGIYGRTTPLPAVCNGYSSTPWR